MLLARTLFSCILFKANVTNINSKFSVQNQGKGRDFYMKEMQKSVDLIT
jgi:hypothetical protein